MRGIDHQQADMFSYLSPEQRVRKDHPLRSVRAVTDEILDLMSPLFDAMYAECGRAIDSAGEAFASAVVADALFGS